MVGFKKNGHIRKITPKMVNPRDTAGNAEEDKGIEMKSYFLRLNLLGHYNNTISNSHQCT